MRTVLSAYYVISMTRGCSISIARTIWLCSVESASRRTILMSGASWWIFMKLRKCGKCIDSINRWTRSSLKRGKMTQIRAVSRKKFQSSKLLVTPNGLSREKLNRWRNKSSRCFSCNRIRPRCLQISRTPLRCKIWTLLARCLLDLKM